MKNLKKLSVACVILLLAVMIFKCITVLAQINKYIPYKKEQTQYLYQDKTDYIKIKHSDLINPLYSATFSLIGETSTGSCNESEFKNSILYTHLKMGKNTFEFGDIDYNFDVTYFVDIFTNNDVLLTQTSIQRHQIIKTIKSSDIYQPEHLVTEDITALRNLGGVKIVVRNIVVSSSLGNVVPDSICLEVYVKEELDLETKRIPEPSQNNPVLVLSSPPSRTVTDNYVEFKWNLDPNCVADSFPNYQLQLLRLYNIEDLHEDLSDPSATLSAIVDWDQALSYETGNKNTSTTLTIAEGSGYYVWRVRPISNQYGSGIANAKNWGVWSSVEFSGLSTTFSDGNRVNISNISPYSATSSQAGFFYYEQFEEDKNWKYNRYFTEGEEGTRVAEAIEYADNLLNVRQKTRYLPSKNNIVTQQTLYDNVGRPTMQTLPFPVEQDLTYHLEYSDNLVLFGSKLYTAKEFDDGISTPGVTFTYEDPEPVNNGMLSDYYSGTYTLDDRIPSAEGYPFSRTIYRNDGTQRVKEQSGVGVDHKIGSNHTIKTMYANATSEELVAVFGDEAYDNKSVQKIINIDQNGIASISYKSKDGKVIASCLNIQQSGVTNSLVNLPRGQETGAESEFSKTFTEIITEQTTEGNIVRSTKKLVLTDPSTSVTIDYDIKKTVHPADLYFCDENMPCFICDHSGTITTTNIETGEKIGDLSATFTIPEANRDCNDIEYITGMNFSLSANLEAGEYEITKIVKSNNLTSDDVTSHLEVLLSRASSTASSVLQTEFFDIFEMLNSSTFTSSTFFASLESNTAWTYNSIEDSYTYISDCCGTYTIPVSGCDPCDDFPPLDVLGRYDFETYLIDKWKDHPIDSRDPESTMGSDLEDYFYRDGAKLYVDFNVEAYTGGEGLFNELINNMADDCYLPCEDLWICWKTIVDSWGTMASTTFSDGSGTYTNLNRDFDLLETFLNCTGTHYLGVSNHPYGSGGGTNEYGYGYLTSAHNYFRYDTECSNCEKIFYNDFNQTGFPPLGILEGGSINTLTPFSATLSPPSLTYSDECGHLEDYDRDKNSKKLWEQFYSCVRNDGRSFTDIDPEDYFKDEYSDLSDPQDYWENFADYAEDECCKACEDRFDSFVERVIDLYHSHSITVQGDKYYHDGTSTTFSSIPDTLDPYDIGRLGTSSTVSLCCVHKIAESLVEHCKESCTLTSRTWTEATGTNGYIGTDDEIQNFNKAMFYDFDIQFPESGQCSASYTLIDVGSNTMTNENVNWVASEMNDYLQFWIVQDNIESLASNYGYHSMNQIQLNCLNLMDFYKSLTGNLTPCWDCCVFQTRSEIQLALGCNLNDCQTDFSVDLSTYDCSTSYTSSCTYSLADYTQNFYVNPLGSDEYRIYADGCDLYYERKCTDYSGEEPVSQTHRFLLCEDVCEHIECVDCDSSICFKWVEPEFDEENTSATITIKTCEEYIQDNIKSIINTEMDRCLDEQMYDFTQHYMTVCTDPWDEMSVTYGMGQYHYTLYYYDRAGNLVKTIPPKGVNIDNDRTRLQHPSHTYETYYQYNSLGQLLEQKSPDQESATQFYYNDLGQLRFSVDAKQQVAPLRFSYTIYDKLGRIVETGEAHNNVGIENFVNDKNFPLNAQGTHQKSMFILTEYTNSHTFSYDAPYNSLEQRFLQNRVSYTVRDADGNINTDGDQVRTIYSYDPHGNVEWVLQDLPSLGSAMGQGSSTGRFLNLTEYEYDLISGNVTKVLYNHDRRDRYYHKYHYDEDNRIEIVETSYDDNLWDKDAKYEYYAHGPLRRIEIGEDSLQGIDYTYTIHGWLKGINHPNIDESQSNIYDPGIDGGYYTGNHFAADGFGMKLNYHEDDYINSSNSFTTTETLAGAELFNGNISSWENGFDTPIKTKIELSSLQTFNKFTGYDFTYDVLNRLKVADNNKYSSLWADLDTEDYNVSINYDPNGNILRLVRNKNYDIVPDNHFMDVFTYTYTTGSNKLDFVEDSITGKPGVIDIDDTQLTGNYDYDPNGNLKLDVNESISSITWTVDNKIEKITKTIGLDLFEISYLYDARGDRVTKYVSDEPSGLNNSQTYTFYGRDANGQTLGIYSVEAEYTPAPIDYSIDWLIYGSASHGRFATRTQEYLNIYNNQFFNFSDPGSTFTRLLRDKNYELKDHLGNVRLVFSDLKLTTAQDTTFALDLQAVNNYYPFGMLQPNRYWKSGDYRFGFNGKENDNEVKGVGNQQNYGARIYDGRIGRWLSRDPLEHQFPYLSAYAGFADNPILFIDPDGRKIVNTSTEHKEQLQEAIDRVDSDILGFLNTMRYTSDMLKIIDSNDPDYTLSQYAAINIEIKTKEDMEQGNSNQSAIDNAPSGNHWTIRREEHIEYGSYQLNFDTKSGITGDGIKDENGNFKSWSDLGIDVSNPTEEQIDAVVSKIENLYGKDAVTVAYGVDLNTRKVKFATTIIINSMSSVDAVLRHELGGLKEELKNPIKSFIYNTGLKDNNGNGHKIPGNPHDKGSKVIENDDTENDDTENDDTENDGGN